MKISFNVDYPDDGFLLDCENAEVDAVRLHISTEESMANVNGALSTHGLKACLCPDYEVKKTGDGDPIIQTLVNDFESVKAKYDSFASGFDNDKSIGISLPVGLHLIVKSRVFAKFGLSRSALITRINTLSTIIASHGHDVVFPIILDDMGLWNSVICDVYDIEMMFTQSTRSKLTPTYLASKMVEDKRLWFGRAGYLGGYQIPAQMPKAVRVLKKYGDRAGVERMFLHSKDSIPEYEWSRSGRELIDLVKTEL